MYQPPPCTQTHTQAPTSWALRCFFSGMLCIQSQLPADAHTVNTCTTQQSGSRRHITSATLPPQSTPQPTPLCPTYSLSLPATHYSDTQYVVLSVHFVVHHPPHQLPCPHPFHFIPRTTPALLTPIHCTDPSALPHQLPTAPLPPSLSTPPPALGRQAPQTPHSPRRAACSSWHPMHCPSSVSSAQK